MFALDRAKRMGPHLEWRVRLFVAAAVLGLAGIYFDDRRLTGGAILLLLAGLALRFAGGAHEGAEAADREDGEAEDTEDEGR